MGHGKYCPKCGLRNGVECSERSFDPYDDKPSVDWSCTKCGVKWTQQYKEVGKPKFIEMTKDE